MNKTIIWIVVAAVVLGGVYWLMNKPSQPASQSIVIALSAQNDSGMNGTATLTDMDGSTLVELDLTGAPSGVAQPAHIHTDSCANIGGIAYPLTSPVDGVSETTLAVSLDALLAQLPLALNVHKSPEEANIYVACGDLVQ